MKELLKIVSKKLFIYSFIVNILYSIADYGQSFALSIFGTSPLTLDKLTKLGISIIIADILILIFGKLGSYIDNVNYAKATNDIEKHYFNNYCVRGKVFIRQENLIKAFFFGLLATCINGNIIQLKFIYKLKKYSFSTNFDRIFTINGIKYNYEIEYRNNDKNVSKIKKWFVVREW